MSFFPGSGPMKRVAWTNGLWPSRSLFSCNESATFTSATTGQQTAFQGTWGFPKWWYPTTMGFPTKNDHFRGVLGYHHFRKPPHGNHQKITWKVTQTTPPNSLKHSTKNTICFFLLAPHRLARWPTPLLGWTSEACTLCTKTWFVWIFSNWCSWSWWFQLSTQLKKILGIFSKFGNHHLGFSYFNKERVTTLFHWISNDGINFLFWQSYNLWRLKCRCLLSFRLSEVCREYGFARCCPHFPHELPDSLWQRGMVLLMASAPVVWHSICLSDA